MAVLMPTRWPVASTSAPPELPGLIAASVWMKFSNVLMQLAASQRTDDAGGDGLPDAEGIADGEHHIADAQALRRSKGDCGELLGIHAQHRQVALGIVANLLCQQLSAIHQKYLDLVGRFDDMAVGEDIAGRADDHARPEARRALGLVAELLAEESAEQRVVQKRMARGADFLAGKDIDDRWRRLSHRIVVGMRPAGGPRHFGAGLNRDNVAGNRRRQL